MKQSLRIRSCLFLAISAILLASCSSSGVSQPWSARYDNANGGWTPKIVASSGSLLFSVTRSVTSTAIFTRTSQNKYGITAISDSPMLAVSPNGEYLAYSDEGLLDNSGGLYESYDNNGWTKLIDSNDPNVSALASFSQSTNSTMAVDNYGNIFYVAEVSPGEDNQNGLAPGNYLIMVNKFGVMTKLLFSSLIDDFSLNYKSPLLAVSMEHNQLSELAIYNYETHRILFTWNKKDVQQVLWTYDGRLLYFIAWSVSTDPNVNGNFVSQVQPSALYEYNNSSVVRIIGSFHDLSPGSDLAVDPGNDNFIALLGWQSGGTVGASTLWLLNTAAKTSSLINSYQNQSFNGDPFGFSANGKFLAFSATLSGYSEVGIYNIALKTKVYPFSQTYFSYSDLVGDAAWNNNQFVYEVGYKPNRCVGVCRATFVSYSPEQNKLTVLAERPGARQARAIGLCGVDGGLSC